jgi:hypothetical protein
MYDIIKSDAEAKSVGKSPEGYALDGDNLTPNVDLVGSYCCKSSISVYSGYNSCLCLFYPSDPISENTKAALLCVADAADTDKSSAMNQWRNIFLAICASPEWQIP